MARDTINFTQSSTYGPYIDGKIEWISTANADTNTSAVQANIYVRKANTTMTLTIPTVGDWLAQIVINGNTYTARKYKSVLEDWVLLYSASTTVNHAADGAKSITISGSITAPSGTSFEGHETKGSGTAKLDTILRATTLDSLTCSTDYLDGNIKILYTPQNSAFYNLLDVYVRVNGAMTLIDSKQLGQSSASQQEYILKFDAAHLTNIYSKIPRTDKANIRVVFRTYSNLYITQVGSDQIRDIVLTVPTSVKPTVSLEITPTNSNSWLASKKILVAGLSSASVKLSATPGSGSTLQAKSITWDGKTYSLGTNIDTANVTGLKASNSIKVIGKVSDYRGRYTTSVLEKITVLSYASPVITSMTVDRGTNDNGWTTDDTGKDVRVVFKTSLSLGSEKNVYAANFTIDNASKTPIGNTSELKTGTSYTVYFNDVDGDVSHTLKLSAKDSVGYTGIATITIPTKNITMEFRHTGKGIAFGKTSEEDAFECAMDAEFRGSVKRIKDDGSIVTLDDTGWIDLGISDSVTTTSSTSAGHYIGCAYRVVNGNHVYVAFNVRAEYSGSAVTVSGNPIPSEYRPKLQPYAIVTLNGKRVSRILVSRTTGHAMIDWIHNVADDTDGTYTPEPEVHTATWIDGYIDYFI